MAVLTTQTVAIVGASSGIGLAAAVAAAREGARVIMLSRSQAKLEQATKAVSGQARSIAMDMLDRTAVDRAIGSIGTINHLILTAVGDEYALFAPIADVSTEQVERSLDKVRGFVNVTRAAAPLMRERGSIILVSGVGAFKPSKNTSLAAAANGAIVSFGRSLSIELAPVRVNVLMPGVVNTPLHGDRRDAIRAASGIGLATGRLAASPYGLSQPPGLSGLKGMRLFVIGANGRTGVEILDLARARGHEVTAFVRSPEQLEKMPGFHVVRGDPRRADSMAVALPGHDAVLSAIGPHPRDALLRPSTLLADCARATVDAMTASGVGRLAIVSAAVLFPEKGLDFVFFRWLLRHHARDLDAMERIVRASGLAWTIARPPRLTHSRDASFVAVRDALPAGSRVMSFRSVAAFMLHAVERRSHVGEVVGLARGLAVAS